LRQAFISFGKVETGARKTKMVVALARKLLIGLWRMVTTGEIPKGVVHVFGDQRNGIGAKLARAIGIVRAGCSPFATIKPCLTEPLAHFAH
jgi:hypothetical protein